MSAVISAVIGQQLTVTGLGRNLKSNSKTDTKHDIKRIDRIIGNPNLQAERKDISLFIKAASRPAKASHTHRRQATHSRQ